MRINQSNSSLPPIKRGKQITVQIDGQQVNAFAGETVAAVLLVENKRIFRHTISTGEPRGIFCGMGICYDCLVTVDGEANVRACLISVVDGMIIETRSEMNL
jgi:sarcosine oxidase subunit alpha